MPPRFSSKNEALMYGDIIGISRDFYDHYGVYINDDSVIHYSSYDSDVSSENAVIETSLSTFCRGDEDLFKLDFDSLVRPDKIYLLNADCTAGSFAEKREPEFSYMLYSPEETVSRARSRLGESNYNLLLNNCEHFAIWCKTGLSKSYQIDEVLKILASESGVIELASLAVKLIAERALHRSCRDFVRNSRILETATAELEKVSRTMKTGQMPFSKYVETNQDVDEALQKRLSLIDAMGKQLLDTLGKI